jgi:hypothetical protein
MGCLYKNHIIALIKSLVVIQVNHTTLRNTTPLVNQHEKESINQ